MPAPLLPSYPRHPACHTRAPSPVMSALKAPSYPRSPRVSRRAGTEPRARPPFRHSCALSVIPAQAGTQATSLAPTRPDIPTAHSSRFCAPSSAAPAPLPPPHPRETSSASPALLDPSYPRSAAGISPRWHGASRSPLRSVIPAPLRHSCAGRNPGDLPGSYAPRHSDGLPKLLLRPLRRHTRAPSSVIPAPRRGYLDATSTGAASTPLPDSWGWNKPRLLRGFLPAQE